MRLQAVTLVVPDYDDGIAFFVGKLGFELIEDTPRGVTFTEAPRREDYGTVAVFRDEFGNLWDLIQYR